MRLRFLCPHHRSQIEADVAHARATWELSYSKALRFSNCGATDQSIAAAGCALEAAEALLVVHGSRAESDLKRFTESALLLQQLLPVLRQPGLVRGLLAGCHARLETLLTAGVDARLVLECCRRLSYPEAAVTRPFVPDISAATVH